MLEGDNMAEQEFTEAGQVGQKLRSGLASAYKAAKGGAKWGYDYINDFVTEYGQEPLLNLYPQAVNLTAAAGEAIAGVANKPVNLGRYPYYNLQSRSAEPLPSGTSQEPEPPEPKATLANRDLLSEYYGGFDNVPVRKAEPVKKKLYRVMFAGKGAEASQTYETKEEADAALKAAGGKGAIAGIDMSRKPKEGAKAKVSNRNYLKGELGEELPAEDVQARKQAYLDKDTQVYANKTMYDDALKRAKSPEYKAALQERGRLANEAKRAKDKEAGAGFESWRSDVKARRGAEDTLNRYNQSIGLLKQAYTQARRSGNFEKAFDISERIQKNEANVPREMGARKKYFEESAIRNRDAMLAEQERLAKLKSTNPDAQ
jgi:hypothetical protein